MTTRNYSRGWCERATPGSTPEISPGTTTPVCWYSPHVNRTGFCGGSDPEDGAMAGRQYPPELRSARFGWCWSISMSIRRSGRRSSRSRGSSGGRVRRCVVGSARPRSTTSTDGVDH